MRTLLLTAGLLVGLSPMCMAGQIYKWVDDQGVTHFSAQPPQGAEAATVIKTTPSAGKPAAPSSSPVIGDQEAIDQEVKRQVADQEVQLKAFCEQARTNLAQLRNNPRVREDVDGEMRRLTEEQRKERITEAQSQIDENCQ